MSGSSGWTCPACRAPVPRDGAWRPFCSERCKMVDLGAWLLGHYRVASTEADEDDATPEPEPPPDDDDADR